LTAKIPKRCLILRSVSGFFYFGLSLLKAPAVGLVSGLGAGAVNGNLRRGAVAAPVVAAVLGGAFDGQRFVRAVELGGVGHLRLTLLLKALTFGFSAAAGVSSLHLDCRLTAAAVPIAGTGGDMAGQFGHGTSFFRKDSASWFCRHLLHSARV